MKLVRWFALAQIVMGARVPLLQASPTMVRLGYSDCATCHISPQGGGMLTTYGKGVDEAQSLRRQEVHPTDTASSRFLYDIRLVTALQFVDSLMSSSSTVSSSTFRLQARSSVKMSAHNRASFAVGVESPTLSSSPSGSVAATGTVYKAVYEYRPKDNVEFVFGRDEMPSGIGLPDPMTFIRKGNDPGDTSYPTQVKAFWYTHRLQLTPYVFGPGGDEPSDLRQHGAGMLAGVDVWNQRAILGVSTRTSTAQSFNRRSVGAYARLGFGKWGILAEHDLSSRVTNDGVVPESRYLAGHTQVFYAPREWLVTSLAAEHLVVNGPKDSHVYRLTPGVQTRISDNLTLIFNMRDAFTGVASGRTRSFSVQLAVKTIQ
jgi:hypothetical protein